jgi:RNase P/RNase MRP subunit p29
MCTRIRGNLKDAEEEIALFSKISKGNITRYPYILMILTSHGFAQKMDTLSFVSSILKRVNKLGDVFMKKKIMIVHCVALLLCQLPAFSDTITLTDGSKVEGRILSASESHVVVRKESGGTVQIPHGEVQFLVFSWADEIMLVSGETLICKIVQRVPPNLIVVTQEGPQNIPLKDVRMYFYHSAQDLRVPGLPATSEDFKNEKAFLPGSLNHKFFIGIQGGGHWPPIGQWREDFMAGAWTFSGGIKAGYHLTESLSLNAGIDLDWYRFTHYDDYTSQYLTLYFSTGATYVRRIQASPLSYIYAGASIGLFNSQGTFYLYSYRSIDFNNYTIAFSPKFGARSFMKKQIALGVEFAYLVAKSGSIDIPVENYPDIIIDFTGFTAFFSILYYL